MPDSRWQHDEQQVKVPTGVAVPVLAMSAPGGKGQKVGLEVVCQSRAGHTPVETTVVFKTAVRPTFQTQTAKEHCMYINGAAPPVSTTWVAMGLGLDYQVLNKTIRIATV